MNDTPQSMAARFEKEVADLYRRLGARVEPSVELDAQRIDLKVAFSRPNRPEVVLAVECKYYASLVGAHTANAFAATVMRLRDKGIVDGGVLVTTSGFTPVAGKIGEEFRIQLLTLLQLREMADANSPILPPEVSRPRSASGLHRRPYIFVVMPFEPAFDDVYNLGIVEIANRLGCTAERADDIEHNVGVLGVLQQKIKDSDIVIADTTDSNPNVMYEVGFAHAVPKDVVLIQRSGSKELPFDLRGQNCIFYPNIVYLRERLESRLRVSLRLS